MRQLKGRAFGLALFFLLLSSCTAPPGETTQALLRRYKAAPCFPQEVLTRRGSRLLLHHAGQGFEVQNIDTGVREQVIITPYDVRYSWETNSLLFREGGSGPPNYRTGWPSRAYLYEYALEPLHRVVRVSVAPELLPPVCPMPNPTLVAPAPGAKGK